MLYIIYIDTLDIYSYIYICMYIYIYIYAFHIEKIKIN